MNPARRVTAVAVLVLALIAVATPAVAKPVPANPRGYIAMYQGACGTAVGWQADANRNRVYASNGWIIYAGRTYDVRCGGVTTASTRKPAAKPSNAKWVHPLPGAPLTSCYGWRRSTGTFHQGLDMDRPMRHVVKAAGAGTVASVGKNGGYGLEVIIRHRSGLWTQYAHLSRSLVHEGQRVSAGQPIARVGNSGHVISRTGDGSHLHFEVRVGQVKTRTNPASWLRARGIRSGC